MVEQLKELFEQVGIKEKSGVSDKEILEFIKKVTAELIYYYDDDGK